mmetsp:Transcript_17674/g.43879  ORF Transcript_17674/g.43879 Transcript_17674/m.43879 type:complete len:161 (-) Transcript_17674:179-661(-)
MSGASRGVLDVEGLLAELQLAAARPKSKSRRMRHQRREVSGRGEAEDGKKTKRRRRRNDDHHHRDHPRHHHHHHHRQYRSYADIEELSALIDSALSARPLDVDRTHTDAFLSTLTRSKAEVEESVYRQSVFDVELDRVETRLHRRMSGGRGEGGEGEREG